MATYIFTGLITVLSYFNAQRAPDLASGSLSKQALGFFFFFFDMPPSLFLNTSLPSGNNKTS